jgi:CHASE3 domain sensor protein
MNRWSFISGLTVTLLLLLMLSGFCVWATRGLTGDISSIINQNYDNIRSIRELRSAMTRLNAHVLVISDISSLPTVSKTFPQEREIAEKRIRQLEKNAATPDEKELVARLTALGQAYFAAYDELFAIKTNAEERHIELNHLITSLTGDVSNVADEIVVRNERF